MDIKELQKMCFKTSIRFSSFKDRNELTQVGVLACLEHLKIQPDADPIKLYFVAKNAMWIDVNIDDLPIKIPRYKKVISIARGEETCNWDNLSQANRDEIKAAVKSVRVPIEEAENNPVEDAYNDYLLGQQKKMLYDAIGKLDEGQQEVILERMTGETLQQISDKLGISKEAVSKREQKAMSSLRLSLLPYKRNGSL
jgi:RNA polymerase sigma factor (sigma-70 family)